MRARDGRWLAATLLLSMHHSAVGTILGWLDEHIIARPLPGPEITSRLYAVDVSRLPSPQAASLAATFVQSARDADTSAYLAKVARDARNATLLVQLRIKRQRAAHAQRVGGWSRYDAEGRYLNESNLVATAAQFNGLLRRLSRVLPSESTGGVPPLLAAPRSLLDVGASNGEMTRTLAAALELPASSVTAMESSPVLRSTLTAAGYRVSCGFHELADASFGHVSLFNVLDRTDNPRRLLTEVLRVLHPAGFLVVAVALPFCSRVYVGQLGRTDAHRPPSRPLFDASEATCKSTSPFERQAAAFVTRAYAPLPLRVAAWTRVPYICAGDARATHHVLDSALFALARTGRGTTARPYPTAAASRDSTPPLGTASPRGSGRAGALRRCTVTAPAALRHPP